MKKKIPNEKRKINFYQIPYKCALQKKKGRKREREREREKI